jgi:protein SMG6
MSLTCSPQNIIQHHALLYREITGLDNRIKQEDVQDEADDFLEKRIFIRGRENENNELEKEKRKWRVADHKKYFCIVHYPLNV